MGDCNIPNRTFFYHDNLDVLRGINSECVDLIYLDPPFAKNDTFTGSPKKIQEIKKWYFEIQRDSKTHFKEVDFEKVFQETSNFKDIWNETDVQREHYSQIDNYNHELINYFDSIRSSADTGIFYYLIFMSVRLIEMHRVLKETGSLYLHCDPTVSHYLKVILDKIFGKNNFRNEIVWHYRRWTAGNKNFQKMHDIILRYTKSDNFLFHTQYEPYGEWIKKDYGHIDEKTGRRWRWHTVKGNRYKVFLEDEDKGVKLNDVWQIPYLGSTAKERTGYPTQKPLALLERIIKASSNEGDVVLDPFCGCATTCIAAEKLNRYWIGIDWNVQAYYMVYWRAYEEGIATIAQQDIFRSNLKLISTPPNRTDKIETIPFYEVKSRAELKRTKRHIMDAQYEKEAVDLLYEEQAGLCNGCDAYMRKVDLTVDHITPQTKGGTDDIDNLQLLCYRCNNWKRTGTMAELVQMLYNRRTISIETAKNRWSVMGVRYKRKYCETQRNRTPPTETQDMS